MAKKKKSKGRPSKYNRVPNLKQVEAMAEKGFTNNDFADVFGVSHGTIDNWLSKHSTFLGAIKRGRDKADKVIEQSLFHRAKGYTHRGIKFFNINGKIKSKEYDERYPPDTMAAMYWLNNRKPDAWRHKQTIDTNIKSEQRELRVVVGTKKEADAIQKALDAAQA